MILAYFINLYGQFSSLFEFMKTFLSILLTFLCCEYTFGDEVYAFQDNYSININLESSDKDSINEAMKEAFEILIVNVSGSSDILKRDEVRKILSQSEKYVNEYKIETKENNEIMGVFSFDGRNVRQLLFNKGLPLWVGKRKSLLVFLPCRHRFSTQEVKSVSELCLNLLTDLESKFSNRVITFFEPIMDSIDIEIMEFLQPKSNIAFLNRLSKRYGVDSWLECFIQDEFGLLIEEANCISSEFPKNRVNMEKSITSLLNEMNKNYQLVIDPTINSRVLLSVSGINNYNLFKLVERIIKSQAIVKDSNIKKIKDSEVTFEVDFMGELSDLEKIMSANNYFLRQPEESSEQKSLYYSFIGKR